MAARLNGCFSAALAGEGWYPIRTMPRPCPRCARPVPDARKACLYCGTEAPPGGQITPAPITSPEPLDSMPAVVKLMGAAQQAMARGEESTVARSVARIYLEVHPDDLHRILATMSDSWLKGLLQVAGPTRMGSASTCCQQALAAAGQKNWLEVARHFGEARAVFAELKRINATAEILALGARQAFEQTLRIQEREGRLEALVHKASRLLTTPGRKAEAIPIFRQALAVLEEDKDRPQNQERGEKIRKVIADFEQTGEGEVHGPASQLPPAGSLSPEGWDDLGMQFLAEHPQHAKVCFERAAKGQPGNGSFWLHLATSLVAVEAPDQDIISVYGLAVMRDPGELKAWVGLAAALQEVERFDEATAAWDEAIKLAPGAEAPRQQRAFCQEADRLLIEGKGWEAKAWLAEGSRRLDANEWHLAEFAFGRALSLAPIYPGALMGKGIANFQWANALKAEGNPAAGLRYQMAAESLAKALELRPEAPGVEEILNQCRTELGAIG